MSYGRLAFALYLALIGLVVYLTATSGDTAVRLVVTFGAMWMGFFAVLLIFAISWRLGAIIANVLLVPLNAVRWATQAGDPIWVPRQEPEGAVERRLPRLSPPRRRVGLVSAVVGLVLAIVVNLLE